MSPRRRDLASLIPDDLLDGGSGDDRPVLRMVPVDEVDPNPQQPRTLFEPRALEALVQSIREHGVLTPLLARRHRGRYVLLAGERRLRAAALAGLHEVPVVVHEVHSAAAQLEVALVENLQRADLDPVEEARGYARLCEEFDHTHASVAALVGRARVTVTNALRLLKLPEAVLDLVRGGRLSAGHARALVPVAGDCALIRLVARVEAEGLSVRATERLVAAHLEAGDRTRRARERDSRRDAVAHLGDQLGRSLHTEVGLRPRADGSGRIVIEYADDEDLDRLVQLLRSQR